MATPTKESYESALKTVDTYEKRQAELSSLEDELSYKLHNFSQVKFKIDKKNKEILFAGLHRETRKIFIGQSKCGSGDKYEPVIGKLIAVKKALHEDVKDVVKLVESSYTARLVYGGSIQSLDPYSLANTVTNTLANTTVNN